MGVRKARREAWGPSIPRHGPARPDHRRKQRGESQFGENDGPVEPAHDDERMVPFDARPKFQRRHCFRACGVEPGDDDKWQGTWVFALTGG